MSDSQRPKDEHGRFIPKTDKPAHDKFQVNFKSGESENVLLITADETAARKLYNEYALKGESSLVLWSVDAKGNMLKELEERKAGEEVPA